MIFSDDDDEVPERPFPPLLSSRRFPSSQTPAAQEPLSTTTSYQVYQAELALFQLKSLQAKTNEWKKVMKHRRTGIMVHMLKPDKVPIFRGQSILHGFSPHSIFYVINMRKLWDEQFIDGHLIENLNDTTSLTYETSTKNRDFCLVETLDCKKDGTIFFACTSVETPKVPPFQGRFRGHLQLLGWVLEPVATGTRVTYYVQEACKSWITGLNKKAMARRPLAIASVYDYLKTKSTYIPLNEKWRSPSRPSLRQTLTSCDSLTTDHSTCMTTLYPIHRHLGARDSMLVRLHRLFDTNDSVTWKHANDIHGLQCYTRDGYARIDGFIRGNWHPEQICAMILCPDTRNRWDSQWKQGKIVERFSQRDYLEHWVLEEEQDMSVLTHIEREAGYIWIVTASVKDGQLKKMDGLQRTHLDLYAWRVSLKKNQQQVAVSLITQTASPWPQIPSALCIMKLQAYLSSNGCPPFIRRVSGKIVVERFDHDQRTYTVSWIVQHHPPPSMTSSAWCTVLCLDDRMFPLGHDMEVLPREATCVKTIGKVVHIYSTHPSLDGQIIQLKITPITPSPIVATPASPPLPTHTHHHNSPPSETDSPSSSSVRTSGASFTSTQQRSSCCSSQSSANAVSRVVKKKRSVSPSPLPLVTPRLKLSPIPRGCLLVPRVNQPHIIHVTDDLAFNGQQLTALVFMMIMAYYLGKAC
ncbi:hypothetical protein DM01DRAFT_1339559 [Hesseltinella vesiculosa]|uniref:START domain-containing protein n=1 Tax=Hesseltinella vesiculosa TaxID=101127 RepID=A0A1X2G6W5_9FUNG|nr:hypothetical protein DM01DRAFT_1339559 [Hesseltinella vesiculosa]